MDLEQTGERVIENEYKSSAVDQLIYLFHIVSYDFAMEYVRGKAVLDFGCGTGYGTHRLSAECANIIGVDISGDAIKYASSHYSAENLTFEAIDRVDADPLPFDSDTFDVVISFQVIEHIDDPSSYLREVVRVLRSGGVFLCATPDRSTRLFPRQKPWNMWHVREFSRTGFAKLLEPQFASVDVLNMGGTKHVLEIELRRTRRLRLLTLPLTLPFVPETVRLQGLAALKKVRRSRSSGTSEPVPIDFNESDLIIGKDLKPSVNLVAVAELK